MTDREKVIKGLECCGFDHCEPIDCPYYVEKNNCENMLMRDALALLKAQEPRVLTLEEALGEDECWIEGRSGACGYGDALISDDGERVDFYRPHSINTLDFYAYNKVWRCWSSRPTDEQREAVKWE